MIARRSAVLLLVLAAAAAGCSPSVDLKQSLEITDTATGWYDVGVVDGKNKLVPSVTFRVREKQDVDLRGVSINAVFRRLPAPGSDVVEDHDEVFVQNAQFSEGNRTELLTLRPQHGYTADPPQTRLEMLQNSQFRDIRAHVYVKQSGAQWVELAVIPIERKLLTR